MIPFAFVRFDLSNLAAIVALALVPLVALPLHRHHGAAKAQAPAVEQTAQHAAAGALYDIAD